MLEKKQIILNSIQEIFRKELEEPELILTYNSSANNIEKWDSINNLILISSIEDFYEISFPIEVIFQADTVEDLCNYIALNTTIS